LIDRPKLHTPELAGRHADLGLERAVKGSDRLKTGIERDSKDWDRLLRRIRERSDSIVKSKAVQEGVEVTIRGVG
jgi:hypothetical protein